MFALQFSWALIEQRKRNNPLCESGGSVAAFGLVLARCAQCRVMLGAVQCCALCSAGGGGCIMLRTVQRCAECSAGRSEALGAVKRCVALRAVHCVALRTV